MAVTTLFVVAVLCALSVPTAGQNCSWATRITGKYISGNNIASFSEKDTEAECKARCCANSACRSADYNVNDGRCFLSGETQCTVDLSSSNNYVYVEQGSCKPTTPTPPTPTPPTPMPTTRSPTTPHPTSPSCTFSSVPRAYILNNNIASYDSGDTAESCKARCCANTQCVSVDFASDGRCFLSDSTQCDVVLTTSGDFTYYEKSSSSCSPSPATPVPTTASPTNGSITGLTENDASTYCTAVLGWTVTTSRATNALVCTKPGVGATQDCNTCTTWRLVVWIDGGFDHADKGERYATLAGHYYGGHNPCKTGWNLPYCGQWSGASPPTVTEYALTSDGATAYCEDRLGWTVSLARADFGALVCTGNGVTANSDCNTCTTWRLVVWSDGGRDLAHKDEPYSTQAGSYYGGHNPCKTGWNLPYCGRWTLALPSPPTPTPTPTGATNFSLNVNGAIQYCSSMGWSYEAVSGEQALVCWNIGATVGSDCNTCTTWRLVVWGDGGRDQANNGETYATLAGYYYGGHNPCKVGWNLPRCGRWTFSTAIDGSPVPTVAPGSTPTPAPATPSGTYQLTVQGATRYCEALGWTATTSRGVDALVCSAPTVGWTKDCNTCTTWRLVVWVDGGHDTADNNERYATLAGHYYGGHNPCKTGWNLPHCGEWSTADVGATLAAALSEKGASDYCAALGWVASVSYGERGALVCSSKSISPSSNCNTCSSWRLLVWSSGGRDRDANGGQTYGTVAGHYYGGHVNCVSGWNLPHCGQWAMGALELNSPVTPVPFTAVPGKAAYDGSSDEARFIVSRSPSSGSAIAYCNSLGWIAERTGHTGALVCYKPGAGATACDGCADWRLVVWQDGGRDVFHAGATYRTSAGYYYGGHRPCVAGWNLDVCGKWSSAVDSTSVFAHYTIIIIAAVVVPVVVVITIVCVFAVRFYMQRSASRVAPSPTNSVVVQGAAHEPESPAVHAHQPQMHLPSAPMYDPAHAWPPPPPPPPPPQYYGAPPPPPPQPYGPPHSYLPAGGDGDIPPPPPPGQPHTLPSFFAPPPVGGSGSGTMYPQPSAPAYGTY